MFSCRARAGAASRKVLALRVLDWLGLWLEECETTPTAPAGGTRKKIVFGKQE